MLRTRSQFLYLYSFSEFDEGLTEENRELALEIETRFLNDDAELQVCSLLHGRPLPCDACYSKGVPSTDVLGEAGGREDILVCLSLTLSGAFELMSDFENIIAS